MKETMTQTEKRKRRRSRGQSLVELAIVSPVLILMLLIAADFGRAYTAYIAVSSSAREGASFGSRSLDNANDPAAMQAAALADNPSIWGSAPSVSASTGTDAYGYDYVEVTVDYTFSTLFPIPPIPASVDMSRTARMRIIGN
jgi:hypothetical protein